MYLKWGLLPVQISVRSAICVHQLLTHSRDHSARWNFYSKVWVSSQMRGSCQLNSTNEDLHQQAWQKSISTPPLLLQLPQRGPVPRQCSWTHWQTRDRGMQGELPKKQRITDAHCTSQPLLQRALKLLSSTKSEKLCAKVKDDNPKRSQDLSWVTSCKFAKICPVPVVWFHCFQTKGTSEIAFSKKKAQGEGEMHSKFWWVFAALPSLNHAATDKTVLYNCACFD